METDLQLLSRYSAARDAEAFAELVRRYAGLVYGSCLRVTGNTQAAEDAAQDCFLQLARHAGGIRTSLPGWLQQTAITRARMAHRGEARRRLREAELIRRNRELQEETDWTVLAPYVDDALLALPEESRDLLIRRFLQGQSQAQLSEDLGISQPTVSRRIESGISLLRDQLKKSGVIVSAAVMGMLLIQNAASAAPATLTAALGKMAMAGVGAAGGGALAATTQAATTATAAKTTLFSAGGITMKLAVSAIVVSALVVCGVVVHEVTGQRPEPPAAPAAATPAPAFEPAPETAAAPAPVASLPEAGRAVVVDPNLNWENSGGGWTHGRGSAWVWDEAKEQSHLFNVAEPFKRGTWVRYFSAPISVNDYPMLIVTYKASHIVGSYPYGLWLDDTRGPMVGGISPFKLRDIVSDGEVHEFTTPLADFNPKGNITGMALSIDADEMGQASFELISLRFAKAEGAEVKEIGNDAPLGVRVVDPAGQPVADATVSVDADWLNFARRAETDAKGLATVTPLKTLDGLHMLRVTRADALRVEWDKVKAGGQEPLTVTLNPAVRYTGKVVDDAGAPVEGAVVEFVVDGGRWRSSGRQEFWPARVVTDEKGIWQSGPINANATSIGLCLSHTDFISDPQGVPSNKIEMADLRAGTSVAVLHRGIRVTGFVHDTEGQPIGGASVAPAPNESVTTDADGLFILKNVRPGARVLTVRAKDHAPQIVPVTAETEAPQLDVTLGPPNTIRFRIVDAKGEPVPQAQVSAALWKGSRTLDWHGVAGADGRVVWTEAPADQVQYHVYSESKEYMPVGDQRLTARDEEYVITLPSALKITGKITDAGQSGQSVQCDVRMVEIPWAALEELLEAQKVTLKEQASSPKTVVGAGDPTFVYAVLTPAQAQTFDAGIKNMLAQSRLKMLYAPHITAKDGQPCALAVQDTGTAVSGYRPTLSDEGRIVLVPTMTPFTKESFSLEITPKVGDGAIACELKLELAEQIGSMRVQKPAVECPVLYKQSLSLSCSVESNGTILVVPPLPWRLLDNLPARQQLVAMMLTLSTSPQDGPAARETKADEAGMKNMDGHPTSRVP